MGNANYNTTNGSPSGPKRCGIFAASALLNNREETGGSYYGIMELTGNVYERAITVGNPAKVVLSQDYTAMEVLPVPELPTSRTGRLLMWGSATGAAVTPMEHNLFRFPTAMMLPIVFLVPMAG